MDERLAKPQVGKGGNLHKSQIGKGGDHKIVKIILRNLWTPPKINS